MVIATVQHFMHQNDQSFHEQQPWIGQIQTTVRLTWGCGWQKRLPKDHQRMQQTTLLRSCTRLLPANSSVTGTSPGRGKTCPEIVLIAEWRCYKHEQVVQTTLFSCLITPACNLALKPSQPCPGLHESCVLFAYWSKRTCRLLIQQVGWKM